MTRIWLNHWFTTAYHIIRMIKERESDFTVIGSNEHPDSVIKNVCDEWHTEPVLEGQKYWEYCLDFCKRENIDMFLPRRGMGIFAGQCASQAGD